MVFVMRGWGRMTRVEGGTQHQGQSMGGWYNPANCPTARLLKIWVWLSVSLPFSRGNRDALLGIWIRDGEMRRKQQKQQKQ
jgi:hypothetical protein